MQSSKRQRYQRCYQEPFFKKTFCQISARDFMFFWFWFCDTALCMKRMNVSVHEEVRNIRVNGDAESKLTLSFGDIKGNTKQRSAEVDISTSHLVGIVKSSVLVSNYVLYGGADPCCLSSPRQGTVITIFWLFCVI